MINLELFLVIGSGILGFISLFSALDNAEYSKFILIFSLVCFGISISTVAHYDEKTLKEETANIIITIQDKQEHHSYNGKIFIHRYYIYFDNGKKIFQKPLTNSFKRVII